MTGARRVRGSRRARAYPAATVPLLLAVFATCIAPAAVAVDVSTGAELLAAVNNATEGEITLKANITTPFEWTQAGVYIKRDLVIESDSAVCGDTGCWITGPTTTSRDFVRVDDGATAGPRSERWRQGGWQSCGGAWTRRLRRSRRGLGVVVGETCYQRSIFKIHRETQMRQIKSKQSSTCDLQ